MVFGCLAPGGPQQGLGGTQLLSLRLGSPGLWMLTSCPLKAALLSYSQLSVSSSSSKFCGDKMRMPSSITTL